MITQDQQRQAIREQLIDEIRHPSDWYSRYESNGGLSKRGKFLQRNKRDFEKDGGSKI